MISRGYLLAFLLLTTRTASAYVPSVQDARTKHLSMSTSAEENLNTQQHWQDFLKFDASPTYDVVAKTVQHTSDRNYRNFQLYNIEEERYDSRYIFRGPVVGPITRDDLCSTIRNFHLADAFPDLDRQAFGHCVDPENPYRVLYFERWKATNTGSLRLAGSLTSMPPSNRRAITPAFPFSATWTPSGQLIYESLSQAVDRFEGNTKGRVAVFGLLQSAGLPLPSDSQLPLFQKIIRFFNTPTQAYSKQEDIPGWWKSQARGADPNDM